MAESKRAGGAEEEYKLPVPPFDAADYVRKETLLARATIVLTLFAFLLGQVSAILLFHFDNQVAALGVLLLGLLALKGVLEVTGVAYQEWDNKAWAGQILLVVFTWLAAYILFQNPPFVT